MGCAHTHLPVVEDGCHDGYVRQVTAAGQLRVVAEQHIALAQALALARAAGTPVPQLCAEREAFSS